ncbi:MAG: hypothetical protein K8T10_04585 [Candidatus Eremiobacteraeota bacterium]|nr:hypothetical protein [Candidatus Eremiobacteraeota bacterium]
MATVFFMKFNRDQGAIIADEMTWHLSFKYGYRPSRYGDNIMNLLDAETSMKNDFVAVYAGIGFPSFHFEVARKAAKKLNMDGETIGNLDKTGEFVENIYQEVHARLINDRLRFNFGFDRDQLNNRKFKYEGKEYDINQESVIDEAKKILNFGDKQEAYQRIFDNEGLVMGYDKDNGIRAYHIENSGRGLEFAYPFDAMGPGKELGTRVFADTSYRMQLEERRKGFSFSDGLFLLLNCFIESYDSNMKTGGYFQIFMIDGKREFFNELTKERNDHNCHLAAEIIRGYRWGYLTRSIAQPLIDRLVIQGEDWEPIENEMFEASSDPGLLKKYLMGFKPANVPNKPLK